jgi:hypothetical protein
MGKNVNDLLASLGRPAQDQSEGAAEAHRQAEAEDRGLLRAEAYRRNKIRRILRRNGLEAATAWAEQHDCSSVLRQIRG